MSNTGRKRKGSGKDNSFITLCFFLAGFLAIYKRVTLTNLIGDNGNAYFGMAYDTYLFLFLLTGYSVQTVLAKAIAARYSVGQYRNTKRVWQTGVLLVLITGVITGAIQYLIAGVLAKLIFHSPQAVPALECMVPLLITSSLLGVFRGYFNGMGTEIPTAISRLIEEGAGLAVLVFFTEWMMGEGQNIGNLLQNGEYRNAFGAGGAGLAIAAGCTAAILFLLLLFGVFQKSFKRWERRDQGKEEESRSRILNVLVGEMPPVILLGLILYGAYIIDQLLYFLLVPETAEKITDWGIYTGKYRIIAGIPAGLLMFISMAAVSGFTGNRKMKQIQFMIKTAFLFALPLAVYPGIMSDTLLGALFQNGDLQTAAKWLRTGSAAMFFQALGAAFACILYGTDRFKALLVSGGSALAAHIISLMLFLTKTDLGIHGIIYSCIILYCVFAVMNLFFILSDMNTGIDWAHIVGTPVIASAVAGLVVFFMHTLLSGKVADGALVFLTIFVGLVLYLVMVLMLHGITEREAKKLPFGNILVIAGRTLHFM